MAQAVVPSRINVEVLRGNPARLRRERVMRGLFFSAAFLSVVISVGIVLSLAGGRSTSCARCTSRPSGPSGWFPRNNLFDIKTIIVGTLIVAAIAMVVAVAARPGSGHLPRRVRLAPGAPLAEAHPRDARRRPQRRDGVLRAHVISPDLVQKLFGSDVPLFNLLAAGIGVGLLVTPLVASVAEDSMYAVPDALREASYGLGARRRATSIRVVFPAAVSGITAAVILGISRAIGETMIVAIAAGGTGGSLFNLNPLKHGQTMTAAITALAIGSDQVRGAGAAHPEPLLRRIAAVRDHARSQPVVGALRPSRAGRVLMARPIASPRPPRGGRAVASPGAAATSAGDRFSVLLLLTLSRARRAHRAAPGRRADGGAHARAIAAVDSWATSTRRFRPTRVSSKGIIGSIFLMVFVVLLAVPLGIGAAIYLEEYARDTRLDPLPQHEHPEPGRRPGHRLRDPRLRDLRAGCSSRSPAPKVTGRACIAGGLTLSLLVLPIVIIITMEALRAVPKGIRDGRLRRRRHAVGGHPEPRAAVRGAGDPHRLGPRASPARSARPPRSLVGAVTGFLATPGGRRSSIAPREVHGAADDDLRVVKLPRTRVPRPGGRRDRGAARRHLRRELPGDPPEEPV